MSKDKNEDKEKEPVKEKKGKKDEVAENTVESHNEYDPA